METNQNTINHQKDSNMESDEIKKTSLSGNGVTKKITPKRPKRNTAKYILIRELLNAEYIDKSNKSTSFSSTNDTNYSNDSNSYYNNSDRFNYFSKKYGPFSRFNIIATVVGINSNAITVDDGSGFISLTIPSHYSYEYLKDTLSIGDLICVIGYLTSYENKRYINTEIIYKLKDKGYMALRKEQLSKIEKENSTSFDSNSNNTSNKNELKQTKERNNISENKNNVNLSENNQNSSNSMTNTLKEEQEQYSVEKVIFDNNNQEKETTLSPSHSREKTNEDKPNKVTPKKAEAQNEKTNAKPTVPKTTVVLSIIEKLDKGDGVDIDDIIKESKFEDCEKVIDNLLRNGEIYEIRPGKLKLL